MVRGAYSNGDVATKRDDSIQVSRTVEIGPAIGLYCVSKMLQIPDTVILNVLCFD